MLKQSHTTRSIASSKRSNLYDKVRQDLFEDNAHRHKRETVKTPSITTICLLQVQAYIIQILTNLPTFTIKKSPNQSLSIYYLIQQKKLYAISYLKSILIQCVRWFLLIVLLLLDNMARILNVEAEMTDITAQKERPLIPQEQDTEEDYDDDTYSTETYHHDPCANTKPVNNGSSEPSSPTKRTLVSPSSPINSPTPNFVVRKTRHSFTNAPTPTPTPTPVSTSVVATTATEESPVFGPARTRVGHIRSLSNNMVDQKKPMSPQKLRRITAQREITLQNGILPIVPKKSNHAHHHHHHHHHTSKKPPVSSSVASRSSSESSSTTKETHDRPRMQKTMSLSTAQQYQNEVKCVWLGQYGRSSQEKKKNN
ncbi:uncharacterized protein ATC70_007154 [Mucor velutinosus]|uniref:Uncharacterized protein n=1 Tax=Mucor velutinosus TaxID=708070 RepID=A0AAN7D8K1_9FUNG|nr:hypothetical protein ATC70_007154 [Mucor velutinosus]